ncbi:MAG: 6-carboxytetrahydropterin synthase [Elusimicrobia bacterium]|nr:6-carboxytetrahydropterin synthase [Elusimicrobiota bacterium]
MFHFVLEFHFCYGHRLMNYNGKSRHPHGHNGRVEVEITSGKGERADRSGTKVRLICPLISSFGTFHLE